VSWTNDDMREAWEETVNCAVGLTAEVVVGCFGLRGYRQVWAPFKKRGLWLSSVNVWRDEMEEQWGKAGSDDERTV